MGNKNSVPYDQPINDFIWRVQPVSLMMNSRVISGLFNALDASWYIFMVFFFSIIQCIDHCLKLKKKSIYFHEFIIYNFYRQIELIVKKYKKDYYLGLFAVLRNPPPHLKTSRKFMVTFKLSILDQIGENHCILRGKNSILLLFFTIS